MNKQGLEVAVNILTQDIMKALHNKVKPVANELFTKFNSGPEPRPEEKIVLDLKLELQAVVLHQIVERLMGYTK